MLDDEFVQATFDNEFDEHLISEASEAYMVNAQAKRRANALDGKTWTKYSISIWKPRGSQAHSLLARLSDWA